MIINCDIVLASPSAVFALPEAKRGLVAIAGALPRLTRIVGRMRAMEMALTGRNVPAQEAKEWGLCNAVCTDGESVVDVAVKCMSFRSPTTSFEMKSESSNMIWEPLLSRHVSSLQIPC